LQEAYDLLAWLFNQRDQLFAKLHDLPGDPWLADPDTKQKEKPLDLSGRFNPTVTSWLEQEREAVQQPHKRPFLPSHYQAQDGDLYLQEVRSGRFTIHRYSNGTWEQWAALSAQDAQVLVAPMQPLGRTQSMRLYYRPTEQEGE
jgi:hypothetical protein